MIHNFVNGDILTPTFMNQLQADLDTDTTAIATVTSSVNDAWVSIGQLDSSVVSLNSQVIANTSAIALNTAAIAAINYTDSTYISMYSCPGGVPPAASSAYIGKLSYQQHFGMVTVMPDRYHLFQEMYPCYSDNTANLSSYAVQCTSITIPFGLGSYSTNKFGDGKNFKVGQWVAFTVQTPTAYSTAITNSNLAIMYGQVTAFTSTPANITVNITYYRKTSTSGANMVVNGTAYLSSAFPWIVRQPESNGQQAFEAAGIAMISSTGSASAWYVPEVEFYSASSPSNLLSFMPATFFLHNRGPLG